jgi:DNA mismatch endonuclease (patch repair protein)
MPTTRAFKRLERDVTGASNPETTAKISARMGRIRRAGTQPELLVRRAVSAAGIRYRTKNKDLPGSPDLANRTKRWAMFVHGCYWHHHAGCSKATVPSSNRAFWLAKFAANRDRDARSETNLSELGYTVVTIWECETRDAKALAQMMSRIARSLQKLPQKTAQSKRICKGIRRHDSRL